MGKHLMVAVQHTYRHAEVDRRVPAIDIGSARDSARLVMSKGGEKMSNWAEALKAIQKLPARYAFGVFLLGLVILLAPPKIVNQFGIADVRDTHRAWIGIATLAVMALWIVQLTPWFQQRREMKTRRINILAYIDGLSAAEQQLLATCVLNKGQTINLNFANPAAQALCDKGLLLKSEGVGRVNTWPYTIPSFVWKFINENRQRLLSDKEWTRLK